MAGGLVAVSMWGLAPVATRAVVAHLAPLPLLVLRVGVAALVLLHWAVPVFGRLHPRSAARLIAAGALGLIGYNLPVTAGLQWLPASTAGLLLATEPVWVMVLGYVFLAERSGGRAWLGSAVALSGVAVLAGPGALAGGGGRALAGAGLVLAWHAGVRRLHHRAPPPQPGLRAAARHRRLHGRGRRPLPGLRRYAVRAAPGATCPLGVGRARLPRTRQHGSRDGPVEPGRPHPRQHPRQPAALPRAGSSACSAR